MTSNQPPRMTRMQRRETENGSGNHTAANPFPQRPSSLQQFQQHSSWQPSSQQTYSGYGSQRPFDEMFSTPAQPTVQPQQQSVWQPQPMQQPAQPVQRTNPAPHVQPFQQGAAYSAPQQPTAPAARSYATPQSAPRMERRTAHPQSEPRSRRAAQPQNEPRSRRAEQSQRVQQHEPFTSPAASVSQPPHTGAAQSASFVSKYLPRILMVVCACVFITCAALLISYFSNIAASRSDSDMLGQVYSAAVEASEEPALTPSATPVPTQTPAQPAATKAQQPANVRPTATPVPSVNELWPSVYPGNAARRVSSVFYELQRQNKDIIGWLKIDGVLEEAVVQRDNEYYLTHNALKRQSLTGALFLDENCDLDTVPTHMLVHGHNMKEGAMFGALKKYWVKDASFYRQHPFIEFNTIYENGRYVIFAVAEVDIRYGRYDYLPFWQYSRFPTVQAFSEYISDARALSHYHCNVDVQPGDRILTLSTCTGTDDNKRLLVMARRLRDGEDELTLEMSILSTYDR